MRIAGDVPHQRVAIECVASPYGGHRCYFLCPLTGTRCEQLFVADGIFASRKAYRLTYASQSEDVMTRARRKMRKLSRQVKGDARYARPRGVNRWRKMENLRAAESAVRFIHHERLKAMVSDKP